MAAPVALEGVAQLDLRAQLVRQARREEQDGWEQAEAPAPRGARARQELVDSLARVEERVGAARAAEREEAASREPRVMWEPGVKAARLASLVPAVSRA